MCIPTEDEQMTADRNRGLLEIVLDNLHTVLGSSIEAIRKGYEETHKFQAVTPLERTPIEIYDIEVFRSAAAVASTIERLRQNIIYMEKYPGSTGGDGAADTQYDWIQYHYGFFLANLVSIPDLLLIAINSVFDLGIPHRHCKSYIILKNAWVKETDIPQRIGDLESIVKPYREPRNMLVHRGRMPDLPQTSEVSLLDYLSFYNIPMKVKGDFVPFDLLAKAWELELPKIREFLLSRVEEINACVESVFDALLPYYLGVRGKYRKQNCT